MALDDVGSIGRRVREARERRGLSQRELADEVGIDRSAMNKVETGVRKVSALELSHIAQALEERIEWFLADAPQPVISRRNLQEPGAPNPAIDLQVERLARHVEFVVDQGAIDLTSVDPVESPASNDAAEAAAGVARELVGLGQTSAALNISKLVESLGLLTFTVELGESADGASLLLASGGITVVNGSLQVGRRRLTLAHELGHYLFADEYQIDWPGHRSGREARIDRFARAFLLPAEALEERWRGFVESDGLRAAAVRLGSEFRVDMTTLAVRLLELRLVNRQASDHIRRVHTTRADIEEFDLLVYDELAPPHLPSTYVRAVLQLYRTASISADRALELLLDSWDASDLPERPRLPESAIWSFVN